MRNEGCGGREVHRQRHGTEDAHQFRLGLLLQHHAIDGGAHDAEAKRAKEETLRERHRCTAPCGPSKGEEAHEADGAIANKIERICLQRLRVGDQAGCRFDDAVAEIEHDDDP